MYNNPSTHGSNNSNRNERKLGKSKGKLFPAHSSFLLLQLCSTSTTLEVFCTLTQTRSFGRGKIDGIFGEKILRDLFAMASSERFYRVIY
jgi:hypothetical protein